MAINTVVQIACIVRDLDNAIAVMEELGFDGWEITEGLPWLKDYRVNGVPADFDHRIGMCRKFGLEWELIEPKSGPLLDWLNEHGPGMQHISVLADEDYKTFAEKAKRISGKDAWLRGEAESIGMDYSFYDLTDKIGMMIEMHDKDLARKAAEKKEQPR